MKYSTDLWLSSLNFSVASRSLKLITDDIQRKFFETVAPAEPATPAPPNFDPPTPTFPTPFWRTRVASTRVVDEDIILIVFFQLISALIFTANLVDPYLGWEEFCLPATLSRASCRRATESEYMLSVWFTVAWPLAAGNQKSVKGLNATITAISREGSNLKS